MSCTRRKFLQAGGLAALGLGLNLFKPENIVLANAMGEQDTKLVFIFQRGGNDGVNTVIPYEDPEYNTGNRPTLFIPRTSAIDLGNDFAGLHPRMAPMMEIYDHPALTGIDGPGNLAIIHRVGYDVLRNNLSSFHPACDGSDIIAPDYAGGQSFTEYNNITFPDRIGPLLLLKFLVENFDPFTIGIHQVYQDF